MKNIKSILLLALLLAGSVNLFAGTIIIPLSTGSYLTTSESVITGKINNNDKGNLGSIHNGETATFTLTNESAQEMVLCFLTGTSNTNDPTVTVTLKALEEEALCRIITEPKNALAKQYQKLLDMDGVKLTFDEGAVRAIAKKALKRKIGARGLRSIVEDVMRDVMYELPSVEGASACRITAEVINGEQKPIITLQSVKNDRRGSRAVTA